MPATYRKIPARCIAWLCFTVGLHTAAAQQELSPDLMNLGDSLRYEGCMGWLFNAAPGIKVVPFVSSPNSFKKSSLLTIHGDVSYDFQYRSLLDTPYYQQDFRQHTVQTNLQIVYKERYPFRVAIRQSVNNSPFFRNRIDVNAQFNEQQLLNHIKKRLIEDPEQWAKRLLRPMYAKADSLKQVYETLQHQLHYLKTEATDERIFSELVKSKEIFLEKKLQERMLQAGNREMPVMQKEVIRKQLLQEFDSLFSQGARAWPGDTTAFSQVRKLYEVKQEVEVKTKHLEKLREEIGKQQQQITDKLSSIKRGISKISGMEELKKYIGEERDAEKLLPKGWKVLAAVKHVGIGRTWLDYSELTIKNISLTGGHLELNPGRFYFAAGVGMVNARFRDFVIQQQAERPRQNLHFLRLGWGRKERSNLIFTCYNGRKAAFSLSADSLGLSFPQYEKIIGVSIENNIRINKNHQLTFEIARSSFSVPASHAAPHNGWQQILNMRDRGNEAYSVKFQSHLPATGSHITGFYRKAGAYFRSFNLQSVFARQEAFSLKWKQPFWRQRILVEAGIRKNDFSTPFANTGIQSQSVFKSFLINIKVPRYPFLLVGYYPSTQFSVLPNHTVTENQYNTLTSVLSYTYLIRQAMATTHLSYLRFFNHSEDTAFIYYNTSNWTASHTMNFSKLQWQTGFSYAERSGFTLTTIEQSVGVEASKWLHLQAGVKYHSPDSGNSLWGGSGALVLHLPKLGRFQLQYERNYLPGINRQLLPVDMGRFNFYKVF